MRLSQWVIIPFLLCAVAAHPAARRPDAADAPAASRSSNVQRFLALPDPSPPQVRALRHLEAHSDHFGHGAWLDAWIEWDRRGFRYQIVNEGGSDYIRHHVLQAALKSELDLRRSGTAERATFTPDNYIFEDRGVQNDGLLSLSVKPRKKDVLLVEGALFLSPDDGDLVRLEGRLSKPPSLWTQRVDVVSWFRRVAGFRMPVAVESVANVLIVGRCTFRMSYEYETVNGVRVGDPQVPHRLTELR